MKYEVRSKAEEEVDNGFKNGALVGLGDYYEQSSRSKEIGILVSLNEKWSTLAGNNWNVFWFDETEIMDHFEKDLVLIEKGTEVVITQE